RRSCTSSCTRCSTSPKQCPRSSRPSSSATRSRSCVKTLHLLRHAKSDWSDPSLTDHDRPLNKRGKRARRDGAEHVDGWTVDLVVCSTARRTRQTVKPVAAELGCEVVYDERLYGADIDEVLAVVRTLPEACDTVMVVGHNPSMEEVTLELCG